MNKVSTKSWIVRLLLLLSLPSLAVLLFADLPLASSLLKIPVPGQSSSDQAAFETQDVRPEILDYIPNEVGLLLSLVHIDVYAQNEVYVFNSSTSQKQPTNLNININGVYTGNISTGEERKVLASLSILKLQEIKIERSFSAQGENHEIVDGSFYKILLIPHISAYVIVFLLAFILWYSLILFVCGIITFVRNGSSMKRSG